MNSFIDKPGEIIDNVGESIDMLGVFIDKPGGFVDMLGVKSAVNGLNKTTYKPLILVYTTLNE